MPVLVINCGSTSIKAAVIHAETGQRLSELRVERLGTDESQAIFDDGESETAPKTHGDAITKLLPRLIERVSSEIESVGHRVVHGGEWFTQPTIIDDGVARQLEQTVSLAPLHNPAGIAGIQAARQLLPDVLHVAVFDTSFHATIPPRAATYALPQALATKHGLRKYGFHGTSHQFVAHRAAEFLGDELRNLRIITCHLGGGCSLCAVEYGRSVETSMGMTPLEGLVMATRCGDIDPAVLLHLMRSEQMSVDEVDTLLNRRAGLVGLSGGSSDFRDIEQRAEDGDESCRLAIQVFCHRIRKYIGAYAAVMGGVDAIVFTAGIGQNSATVRHHVTQRLEFLGARLDEDTNREARVSFDEPVAEFSTRHSRVRLLAARTDEAWEIAKLTRQLCSTQFATTSQQSIPVAISARHIHLTQETVEALFGDGHQLTPLKPLSQPGQFAAVECVTLIGPKRQIERVRVLGPTRGVNQVEISRTDEFYLGIDAPIRASGDVDNTPGITLVGNDDRKVSLDHGVICAWRHIHMTPADAEQFGVKDKDVVEVDVGKDGGRSLTFGDVLVRVKSTYCLEMHIDTDEGNAAELDRQDIGRLEAGELIQQVGAATKLKRV
ncbi:MAG: acetate/propionate family kinase [Pirellulaceae bacterium]